MTPKFTQAMRRTAAAVAVASVAASTLSLTANADPKQYTAFVGVGSDTTQDVLNALSGSSNGLNYSPVQSSAATGRRQVISFDATPPPGTTGTCIITKAGGPAFERPNGSSGGRRALSRSIDGTGFGNTGACGATPANVSGQVNFARSSAGPASGDTGTALTYIPFGRDGVSFAAYRTDGGAVTTLTQAQLTSLFSTGRQTINGVSVLPCGIQNSSGTFSFWNGAAGVTTAQEATATAECNALLGRAQENDGVDLKARGDAADAAVNGTQVVIGFSAAAYVAKTKLVAEPAPPAGVEIGEITGIGSPVIGSGASIAPNPTFYNNATFGRNVYNVFPTAVIDSAFGNADIKSLFKGATATLCAATTTIQTFGFIIAPNCGASTLKGSLFNGQNP
jgi:hypothetical protein